MAAACFRMGGGLFALDNMAYLPYTEKVGTDISRVMYFFYYGGRIILTNGFIKKTQKTPRSEIERAKQYRKDFLEREGESDENTGSVFE